MDGPLHQCFLTSRLRHFWASGTHFVSPKLLILLYHKDWQICFLGASYQRLRTKCSSCLEIWAVIETGLKWLDNLLGRLTGPNCIIIPRILEIQASLVIRRFGTFKRPKQWSHVILGFSTLGIFSGSNRQGKPVYSTLIVPIANKIKKSVWFVLFFRSDSNEENICLQIFFKLKTIHSKYKIWAYFVLVMELSLSLSIYIQKMII